MDPCFGGRRFGVNEIHVTSGIFVLWLVVLFKAKIWIGIIHIHPDYHGTFYSINGNLLDTHLALPLSCDCFLSAQILHTLSWTLLVGQYLCAVLLKSPDLRLWFLGSSSDMVFVLNQRGLGHRGNTSNTLHTHFTTVEAWAGIYKPTGDSFCTKNSVNFILK